MRDPLQEPRFGDVFEFVGDGITYRALYLWGSSHPTFGDEWTGLTLDDGYGIGVGEVTTFVSLNKGSWITGWRDVNDDYSLAEINARLDAFKAAANK